MKTIAGAIFIGIVLTAVGVFGQTAAAGRAAYGRAFEAAGASAAAGRVRSGLGAALKRAAERPRTRPDANARPAARASRTAPRSPRPPGRARAQTPAAAVPEVAVFTPNARIDTMRTLANELGSTAEERDVLLQLFRTTKTSVEQEMAAKGRSNNLVSGLTFFIAVAAMTYHDDPEPSDAALDMLWDGLNGVFAEMPEFQQMSDRDKQEMYDTLISFGGLVLVGYMQAKESGNAELLNTYRILAGELIRTVLKTEPEKLRFTAEGIAIG